MTNYIFTYLAPNKLAGLINNSTKKEKMSQSKADKIRTNIENWTTSIFTILGRFFIAVLVLAVFTMVYKGLSNDHYLIQAFQVPFFIKK